MMTMVKRPIFRTFLSYLLGIVSIWVAFALREILGPILVDRHPFPLFYFAVAVTAWFGGLWPGLFATFCGLLLASWFFVPSRGVLNFFSLSSRDLVASFCICSRAAASSD
jgi:K+-sensing histidine kinase KdpD